MTSGPTSFTERRSEPRIPANTQARLCYGPKFALWADCIIKDISLGGAKVAVSSIYKLPPEFVLLNFQAGAAFEVQLRWRKADLAGVSFLARHDLATLADPRLAEVRKAWQALGPAMRSS
jgi:hypothetical protein